MQIDSVNPGVLEELWKKIRRNSEISERRLSLYRHIPYISPDNHHYLTPCPQQTNETYKHMEASSSYQQALRLSGTFLSESLYTANSD